MSVPDDIAILAGTSGWSYPHWKPDFYPKGMAAGQWLSYYVAHLPCVEINNSFYRPPSEKMIAGWTQQAPSGFRFAVKAWKEITHECRLRDCELPLHQAISDYRLFGETLGPVLFQLPPTEGCDLHVLKDFLSLLPSDIRAVFEFRHPSWRREEVYRLLADKDASFCLSHVGEWQGPRILTSSMAYIRLHGADRWFEGEYSEEFLAELAEWLGAQRLTAAYGFFNNTKHGVVAPQNAMRLNALSARLPELVA